MILKSINPYTKEVLEEYKVMSEAELSRKLELGNKTFKSWKTAERSSKMQNLGHLLIKNKTQLAHLVTAEMGKILREAEAEVEKSALTVNYYIEHQDEFLSPRMINTDARESYIQFDPLGVILAIMPWNFPFWQVLRFAIPTILCGNVVVLKHASNVTGCALALEKLFLEAGFPEGVFQTLIVDSGNMEMIISSPLVRGVTLTGSNKAGSSVAGLAGKYIKKSVLELGGSDPFIVLNDADIAKAAETAVRSRFQNAGQTCIAAKRWIVESKVAAEFTEKVSAAVGKLSQGNPLLSSTHLGPLAKPDLAESLARQIAFLKKENNELLTGGTYEDCNFQPTLIAMNKDRKSVFNEETFGPLACIYEARNEQEAIDIANETTFGLGASIWTGDLEKGKRLAGLIESGFVSVNNMVKSDPKLPFGGVKDSGYGRELSYFGMHEFTNVKSVWVDA